MKKPVSALSQSVRTLRKSPFLKPFRRVLIDLKLFSVINFVLIYCFLFLIPDTSIAMVGTIWVGIIAWQGGMLAGLIASIIIYFSALIAIKIPPHNQLPLLYVLDNRVPSFVIGITQSVIIGLVVGYISSLVHRLRDEVILREKEVNLREKIQKDLEQKVAELNTFGHTVAHDLKNPVMVINMAAGILGKELANVDNKKVKKSLSYINDGIEHMINIIETILLLSGIKKISADEYTTFPISQCVNEALERMNYSIESNRVTIKKPDKWPTVFGYAPWITEVWVNYINNAIKYGGKPSRNILPVIELGYDDPGTSNNKSDHYKFWVKDNGSGIPKEKVGQLFKEFARVHDSKVEGHGLGLSIVSSILSKFDGMPGVESELEKGSTFFFTLPIKKL